MNMQQWISVVCVVVCVVAMVVCVCVYVQRALYGDHTHAIDGSVWVECGTCYAMVRDITTHTCDGIRRPCTVDGVHYGIWATYHVPTPGTGVHTTPTTPAIHSHTPIHGTYTMIDGMWVRKPQ